MLFGFYTKGDQFYFRFLFRSFNITKTVYDFILNLFDTVPADTECIEVDYDDLTILEIRKIDQEIEYE